MNLRHSLSSVVVLVGTLVPCVVPFAANAGNMVHFAQLTQRPPDNLSDEPGGAPLSSDGQDASALLLRIDKMQSQLRQMTGKIEELEFKQRKLEQALQGMPQGPVARDAKPGPIVGALPLPARGGDAFDPAVNPGAIGAPRPLGGQTQRFAHTPPNGALPALQPGQLAGPDVTPTDAPVDGSPPDQLPPDRLPGRPLDLSRNPPVKPSATFGRPFGLDTENGASQTANIAPASTLREDYASAFAMYKQGRYQEAEAGLTAFLAKHPKGTYTADAIFYLGESYSRRNLDRQAAEQYLKLSTDFSKSAKAPQGLVRLGMSLNAMGAKEQACAALGEVARKYPLATQSIKQADLESKRDHC